MDSKDERENLNKIVEILNSISAIENEDTADYNEWLAKELYDKGVRVSASNSGDKLTNYELIKNMSIKEMAEFLRDRANSYCEYADEGECIHGWHSWDDNDCLACAIKYLESEINKNA